MEHCISTTCQFCDKDPGYLVAFAKAWACNFCLSEYGLGYSEVTSTAKSLNNYFNESYDGYDYTPRYVKPYKVEVTIEELECDSSNLASFAKVFTTNTSPKKEVESKKWTAEDMKFKSKKWTVDIWD